MIKKKNSLEDIAKLLPEGLDEKVLTQIAGLVGDKLNEEVTKVKEDLTRKFTSFMRGKIDSLKEQALKELELDNDTYRKAKLYETAAAIFAVENTAEDEINGGIILANMNEDLESKVETLVGEVERLLNENVKFKNAAKAYYDKSAKLEEQVTLLKANMVKINESSKLSTKAEKFSDVAKVITRDNFEGKKVLEAAKPSKDKTKLVTESQQDDNEFLTPDMMERFKILEG